MIHAFSTGGAPTVAEVGGKARSLIEVTHAGFPVPDGIVLSVEFFRPWLREVQSSAAWAGFSASAEENIKGHCDAVKEACQRLELTPEQRSALDAAMETLAKDATFAVRSSSPEEDLEGTSFAGGYETTLGVKRDTLVDAICHSFASVFDERVVWYKIQHGMATDQPRIAVIIQEQIASDASGVAFSLNPTNNCYDEAVVNSNFGLGETVVQGQVTPDAYVVEKVRGEILERTIADKSHALWLEQEGGCGFSVFVRSLI